MQWHRALTAFSIATLIFAQENGVTTFRTESNLVSLNVSVFDKDGHVVKGLPQSAFTVFEDNQKQEIKVFRQEDVPISLGLAIDASASMLNKRERVISAALAMVKASNPDDEVFVINFSEAAFVTQEFTSDVKRLESGLRKMEPKGETAMRDALSLGLDHLRAHSKKDKKVLLVITDGEDNSSIQTQENLIRAAHLSNVIIYAIGILGSEQPASAQRAKASLDALTLATGGRSWFPNDVADIAKITPEIAHEIRNQYVIGYTPENTANTGAFRSIRVEVNVPNVTVRTRSGYYPRSR
ncbi:MAG: von Willebrand factor, type [Candidatus Solibacter sp.]|jgi:Ca-activated chloride channel family protein|nr:von Willebrand factor, type [Candidatus Solibacter sp.]